MKTWTQERIKELLTTNDTMVVRSLIKLYNLQTDDEQRSEETVHSNGVGFNGCDSQILTSISKQYISKGFITPKQMVLVRKKIFKYSRQLTLIANGGL